MLPLGLLFRSCSPRSLIHPRLGPAHSGLVSSASMIKQENGPQDCPQVNLMEAFSQLRFLFPGNSSWCQANKTTTATNTKQKLSIVLQIVNSRA